MGVFDYKNAGSEVSKALYSDAMAITLYSYHNLDNGFAVGYQQHGFGLGLPATLVVKAAGWTPISASQLGYVGKTDGRGTFYGEKAGYTTGQAEVLGKYDAQGHLMSIGIAFRGTSGPRETVISDTLGDAINDLLAAIGPRDYARSQGLCEKLQRQCLRWAAQECRHLCHGQWPEWSRCAGQWS